MEKYVSFFEYFQMVQKVKRVNILFYSFLVFNAINIYFEYVFFSDFPIK